MNKSLTELNIDNLSKKFNKDWIFKAINLKLISNNKYAFIGSNGSGKSTLMQCLAGQMPATVGTISISIENEQVKEDFWKFIAFTAPYLELIEEFTLREFLTFHASFKPFKNNISTIELINLIELESASNKQIKFFSSGMKQRVKLALCFYSNCPILFFDEPTTNLDQKGIMWYKNTMLKECQNKVVLIFSNLAHEYDFTRNVFELTSKSIYKIA